MLGKFTYSKVTRGCLSFEVVFAAIDDDFIQGRAYDV